MPEDDRAQANRKLIHTPDALKALIERNNEQIRKNQELLDKIKADRKARRTGPVPPPPSASGPAK